MRVTFIGTSHGRPEPHRRCTCTMIETSGRYYFIDMGTQAIEDITKRGIDIHDVKGIFLTHSHGDHCDGLISFVDLISWYYKKADPTIVVPHMGVRDGIKAWLTSIREPFREDIRFESVNSGVTYDDGFLRVTAIPTAHCTDSFAYYLETEGKKVLFTGDLRNPNVDFPQIAFEEELDLIVVESAHFSPEETEKVLEKCSVKRVLVHHISGRWGEELCKVVKREHTYRYGQAYDGMEIVL